MDEENNCPLTTLCERLGTLKAECANAGIPKHTALESARRKYNGDVTMARLEVMEDDISRIRACVMTVLKLLA